MNVLGYDWNGTKVLVTGASGFKGAWLCAALVELGARVFGTVRNHVNPLAAYAILELDHHITTAGVDIDNRQSVYDLINTIEPDVIFHLAAKALVPVSLRDPRRTYEVNVMGTSNVIEACRRLRICNRLLICSTDHVFGSKRPPQPISKWTGYNEASRVSYGGPYDTSKAMMELMIRSYHREYWNELPAIGITRCANVFGYGDTNQRRLIPMFVSSAVQNNYLHLKYRKSGRQFIHVTDAVSGYIRAASVISEGGAQDKSPFTPTFHFAIENYGGKEPFARMAAVAKQIAAQFDARVDASGAIDYPKHENPVQALNCEATRRALKWQVRKSFESGTAELGDWYRNIRDKLKLRELIRRDVEQLCGSLNN
jgi:CDP-glucose 4,6-dehydratase